MNEGSVDLLRRAAAVLDIVLELSPAERPAAAREECRGDPELLAEVMASLALEEKGDDLFDGLGEAASHLLRRMGWPRPEEAPAVGSGGPEPAEPAGSGERDRAGKRIAGRYRLVRKVGAGGMGVVWEAWDEELGRKVALKFLSVALSFDDGARQRLLREARAASRLSHANICTVYEVGTAEDGELYVALAYCEGPTLRERIEAGPLPLTEVVTIALAVARALQAAHGSGVLHRDVKPGNIMAPPGGEVRLLDFGLAHGVSLERVTGQGRLLGTPAYMSPERLQGEPCDLRADLWALGVVLFEMITGRFPFQGRSGEASLSAILTEAPPAVEELCPGVPERLGFLVRKSLEKSPALRMQSAAGMVEELLAIQRELEAVAAALPAGGPGRWLGSRWKSRSGIAAAIGGSVLALGLLLRSWGPEPNRASGLEGPGSSVRSVAVLPFEDLTPDASAAYLADGMTDELIGQIGQISGLDRVISRTSVMGYKGTAVSLTEIGRELGVDAVVEGSVTRIGPEVRVLVRLMGLAPEAQLWNGAYRRTVSDILTLSGEITQAIAREIRLTLTPDEETRLQRDRPVDPEAFEAYLEGRYHLVGGGRGPAAAAEAFERSIAIDPEFARGYVGLAEALPGTAFRLGIPLREAHRQARDAALHALTLDSGLAEAWAVVMRERIRYEWNWQGAAEAIDKALEIQPNSADVRFHHA